MTRRYEITVAQTVEEVYEVEADSYEEACNEAEELFRDEFGIDSWMGDYTCLLHSEEEIEDYDDMQDIIDDDNRQRAADMNAALR